MSGASSSKLPLSTPHLPRLPVELLRQIVEQSVPSYYHSLTYQTRQLTLRNLCLTSQLFREIAQPLLGRFDCLRILHNNHSVEQIVSLRSSKAHVLAVRIEMDMRLERMNPLLLSYRQLKELHIDSGYRAPQGIATSLLAALPCLESVALYRSQLIFSAPHPPLLALKYLTLTHCYGNLDALFAQPSFLPSLKVLALLGDLVVYEPVNNTGLLSQLDLFIGKPRSLKEEILKAHADKILCAYRYDEDIPAFPGHLNNPHFRLRVSHVDIEHPHQAEDLYEVFKEILGFVNFSDTSLKTLFLDQGLRDALEPFRFTQVTYDELIKTCKENGTEVILEEQAVIDSADSAVTPELLRWMARRKRSLEDERK